MQVAEGARAVGVVAQHLAVEVRVDEVAGHQEGEIVVGAEDVLILIAQRVGALQRHGPLVEDDGRVGEKVRKDCAEELDGAARVRGEVGIEAVEADEEEVDVAERAYVLNHALDVLEVLALAGAVRQALGVDEAHEQAVALVHEAVDLGRGDLGDRASRLAHLERVLVAGEHVEERALAHACVAQHDDVVDALFVVVGLALTVRVAVRVPIDVSHDDVVVVVVVTVLRTAVCFVKSHGEHC